MQMRPGCAARMANAANFFTSLHPVTLFDKNLFLMHITRKNPASVVNEDKVTLVIELDLRSVLYHWRSHKLAYPPHPAGLNRDVCLLWV